MSTLTIVKKTLRSFSDKHKAVTHQRFFKTGPGEYGAGDVFIGVTVPNIRVTAKLHSDLSLSNCKKLLNSKVHEDRLLALIILVNQYKKASEKDKLRIFNLYTKSFKHINNWDLVDLSAHYIVGPELINKNKTILISWARSSHLWTRRIAILSTFHFIKNNDYKWTFKIAKILLKDEHDLIHKAVGWMLREVGKRDLQAEEIFLKQHYKIMPRTMLRYSIEKFPEQKRLRYLKGKIS